MARKLGKIFEFHNKFQITRRNLKKMIAHCRIGYRKTECSYSAEGNTNWCELSGQQVNKSHKKP